MQGRAGRIGLLIATLLLALPSVAVAGSSQAPLSIGAVVAARCAVRTPGSLRANDASAPVSRDTVAMRCTKGTLPSAPGASASTAVGPRVSRDLVLTAASSVASPPRAVTEAGAAGLEPSGPRLVITVNF